MQVTSDIIPGAGNSETAKHYSYLDKAVESGKTYYYKLADVDYEGNMNLHGPVKVSMTLPSDFVLEQNYPNPFNPETTISFNLDKNGYCELSIFNLRGQRVRTLVASEMSAGTHSVVWDGKDQNGQLMPSGIYIYKLQMNGEVATKMMDFIK
jgi:hypothetical protein